MGPGRAPRRGRRPSRRRPSSWDRPDSRRGAPRKRARPQGQGAPHGAPARRASCAHEPVGIEAHLRVAERLQSRDRAGAPAGRRSDRPRRRGRARVSSSWCWRRPHAFLGDVPGDDLVVVRGHADPNDGVGHLGRHVDGAPVGGPRGEVGRADREDLPGIVERLRRDIEEAHVPALRAAHGDGLPVGRHDGRVRSVVAGMGRRAGGRPHGDALHLGGRVRQIDDREHVLAVASDVARAPSGRERATPWAAMQTGMNTGSDDPESTTFSIDHREDERAASTSPGLSSTRFRSK